MKLIRSHPVDRRNKSLWPYRIANGCWYNFDSEKDLDILRVGPNQFEFDGGSRGYRLVHSENFPKDGLMRQFAVLLENYKNRMHPGDMVARIGKVYDGLYTEPYVGNADVCRRIMNAYTYALWEIMNGHVVSGIWERKGAVYLALDPNPDEPRYFGYARCWGTKKPFQDNFRRNKSCIDELWRNQMDALLYGHDVLYSFNPISFDGNTDEGRENVAQFEQLMEVYEDVFHHTNTFLLDRYDMNRLYDELENQIIEFIEKVENGSVICPTLTRPNVALSDIPAYVKWRIIADTIQIIEDNKCCRKEVKTVGQYFVRQAKTDKIISGGAFLASNFVITSSGNDANLPF